MAALVDAGADPLVIAELVGRLDLDGYALTFEDVMRCGVAATQAHVVVLDDDHDHDHDTITSMIATAATGRSAN